jgi:hypothetical protein
MLALWLLRRKNLLLLSPANNLRYTDTCFICAFAMVTAVWRRELKHLRLSPSTAFLYLHCASQRLQGIAYTRAVAAVVSVGAHLQPFASSLSALAFHVGSLYLTAHLRCKPVLSFKSATILSRHPPPPPPPPPPVFSIIEIAAIVELILYPAFMALRVTLLPIAPPPPPASATAPAPASRSASAVN